MPANREPARVRPIRELVWPEAQAPIQPMQATDERRHYHRYDGQRRPGVMVARQVALPVECVDISYGGMQVFAPLAVLLHPGEQVHIRFEQHARVFSDVFTVRHANPTAVGTAIHLSL